MEGELGPQKLVSTVKEASGLTSLDSLGITSQGRTEPGEGITSNSAMRPGPGSYDQFLSKKNSIFNKNRGKTHNSSDFDRDEPKQIFFEAGLYAEYWKWINCQRKVFPFKCLDCGRQFYVPFRCDLRICPECNRRYERLFKARYLPLLRRLLRPRRGKNRPKFVTLTTKNTGEIPERAEIQAHNKAVGKLLRSNFKGGVFVNEVKGTYLHTHCIVDGPYVPQAKLSRQWEALTGNKIVDIREIREKASDVINYLGSYVKKPYHYEKNENGYRRAVQFLKNFKGIRRVHSFGSFYGIKPSKDERPQWACPFCESDKVILDLEKFSMDWTMRDCKVGGIPSYKSILEIWKKEQTNTYAYTL